jgi:predicted DNA-binding transcriptional regulator YafY
LLQIKEAVLAKHDYDRAMYRITTIVSRLNIGERLFLPDLASEFGVSLRTIQKDFSTRHGKKDSYLVDPYRLGNFDGFWYLIAMDNKAGILKTFYLKSIENIRVSPENYAIDSALEKEIEETYGNLTTAWFKEEKQNVNLLAVGAARRYIMRNPGPQIAIIKDAPDGLHLQMTYHRDVEVLYFVKHWLPDIRIIGNPHLKKMLMDQIKNYSG